MHSCCAKSVKSRNYVIVPALSDPDRLCRRVTRRAAVTNHYPGFPGPHTLPFGKHSRGASDYQPRDQKGPCPAPGCSQDICRLPLRLTEDDFTNLIMSPDPQSGYDVSTNRGKPPLNASAEIAKFVFFSFSPGLLLVSQVQFGPCDVMPENRKANLRATGDFRETKVKLSPPPRRAGEMLRRHQAARPRPLLEVFLLP